jgi:hypothetical protein
VFDGRLPSLTLPALRYSELETPYDLAVFLYRGAASMRRRGAVAAINEGKLGPPLYERIAVISAIHEELESALARGASRLTFVTMYRTLSRFIAWADDENARIEMSTIHLVFAGWTEFLLHRRRLGTLKNSMVYSSAFQVGGLLDRMLDRRRGTTLGQTRVKAEWKRKNALGTQADKQNLLDTWAFGHMLLDFAESLTPEVIVGPLPVVIRLRSGKTLELWGRLRRPGLVKSLSGPNSYEKRKTQQIRAQWSADSRLATRYSFVNLRIEAEQLIFIGQTGMNLAQTIRLQRGQFSYQSHLDGYQVRRLYKSRKKGEVEFEIFGAYRDHFERYLGWIRTLPDDGQDLLFPFVAKPGSPLDETREFSAIRRSSKQLGVLYFGPRKLRRSRVNWLLRRSQDPQLTSEMAQHAEETLLRHYERPHHQVAVVEISRFLSAADPAIVPPGPGACVEASPLPISNIPRMAPQPDCASPAVCLFCVHHRDIDCSDHVWSLCSYKYLKTIELARLRPTTSDSGTGHPAVAVIERVDHKLRLFEASSEIRHLWVREALARVDEGTYHPKWDGFIALAELR